MFGDGLAQFGGELTGVDVAGLRRGRPFAVSPDVPVMVRIASAMKGVTPECAPAAPASNECYATARTDRALLRDYRRSEANAYGFEDGTTLTARRDAEHPGVCRS